MSKSGSPSDKGSSSSSSRFELAMLKSSGPLLESCTKETLDDLHHCEPSFHQWRYCYKMCLVKACTGYAECACWSERERIVFGKKKAYCTWKNRCAIKFSGQELADVKKVLRVPKEDRHLGKLRPLFQKYSFQPYCIPYFDFSCSLEKVSKKWGTSTKKRKTYMLVLVDDILFHKKVCKHRVRPASRPKSQDEVFKITASKKVEVEAIKCAAAIVAGEERRLLPHLPTINPIFPLTMDSTDQEGDLSSSRRQSTVDELGEPLDENKSDCDRMMRLSSYVMTECDDRLREIERYKAKFKDNKQLVNDARKTSKALAEAIRLKDQNFKSLKRRNEELDSALVEISGLKRSIPSEKNVTVQEFLSSQAFHDTFRPHCIRAANFEKRKWMTILERYDNKSVIRKYHDEMDEYRQRGETFVITVDASSEDDSDNEASVGE
ncbi:hypothetical protein D8674_031493 [Pyrus ussuriensis x Pyrus communis]|uniref:GRIP domain-containing protein RUD3-like n=1 Tax=Pyrus ussuriensis x Pyrus communis TaxID=2448454 RepID=A0A5N5EZW6_9ROSA|nr:hypothetical protein D8674_031493 [Pyrus ussuriensis x Pyrus communis]